MPKIASTQGLEMLAEKGNTSLLRNEVKAAAQRGEVGRVFESEEKMTGPTQPVVMGVVVDRKHPYVSLVSMFAPSPDWFAGVSNVKLLSRGKWVPVKIVNVYAFDAGTDNGKRYTSQDEDAKPKKGVSFNYSSPFYQSGKHVPVGVVVFVGHK